MRKKSSSDRRKRFQQTLTAARLRSRREAPPLDQPLLTIDEAARLMHASRGFVYSLVLDGLLPSISIRRLRRIRQRDLDEFVQQYRDQLAAALARHAPPRSKRADRPIEGRLAKWKRAHGR